MSQSNDAIPEEISAIPEHYKTPARRAGQLVRLDYDTWESRSYGSHTKKLRKSACVYLPYGYTDSARYNVFYLMHGGWGNETTEMGPPEHPGELKHALDHAIEDGLMAPLIVVLPTYNNESRSDSGDYHLALILTANYHNELVNDLMPAVEGRWRTYADGTAPEDFRASRDHRGFGGFSMGSVATWRVFEHCLDYFRYFMPMSGNLTSDDGYMEAVVRNSGHSKEDFFLYTMSGSGDFACSAFKAQIRAMARTGSFELGNSEREGNMAYREKPDYVHDAVADHEYAYNGLLWFWNHTIYR